MAKWRVKEWLKNLLPSEPTPGDVATPDAPVQESSTDESPITSTFATAVTEAESHETLKPFPKSTTAASIIGQSGPDSTASVMSLSSVVEMSNEDLESTVMQLDPRHLEKLNRVAIGSGQPLAEVVRQIAIYLLEEESEFEEMGLAEAIAYYTENQIL